MDKLLIKLILLISTITSLITDIKKRKILNVVTFPTILFGLIYHTLIYGIDGLLFSGKGFLVGLVVLLIPYLLGGMGAGDVKLMAAIGALTGPVFVFYSFIYTALVGGVIALILIMKRDGLLFSVKNFYYNIPFLHSNLGSMIIKKDHSNSIVFPYGIAIVSGTLIAALWRGIS